MFLYDRYRPSPFKKSELFNQIGCFGLKFKYTNTDSLASLPLLVKNDFFTDVNECWKYTHSHDEISPFEFRTTELEHTHNFEFAWMCLVEWLTEIETGLDADCISVVYHMCKRLMNKISPYIE